MELKSKIMCAVLLTALFLSLNRGDLHSVHARDEDLENPVFQLTTSNPQWRILVLIYNSTDFSYSDNTGQHQVVASMTQAEIDRAISVARRFVEVDIPALTSGYMVPLITIRQPTRSLADLESFCGYWPTRASTTPELDATFDSAIVIWDDTGTDVVTGQMVDLNGCGGIAASNGAGQTYSTIPIDSVTTDQQNVFKHEWGHSILFYYEATGATPLPTVDNHINSTANQYVSCETGNPYILLDETNDNPVLNSIYNNNSGFTHDYYSGLTAKPENPSVCLGINESVWATGGPVTKPSIPNPVDILINGGFEDGTSSPSSWNSDAWQMANSVFTWDNTRVHTGNRSIKISSDPANDARWIQTITVHPNTEYRLSGWIMTDNVVHSNDSVDAGANLSILDGSINYTTPLVGDTPWTYVSMDFNSGSKTQVTVAARLGMYSGTTTGWAWFDDLKLETANVGTTFADVPLDHPLHDYIEALYDAGYTAGCSTSPLMYCPETILDRAQSAVFMLRGQMGSGYTPPAAPWNTFVNESWVGFEWAQPWAEGMWQEGLTKGCQNSPLMYCPATQLPRVEASVFGLRMKYGVNYTPPAASGTLFADFPSTDPSYWAIDWAEQAYKDGLLPACGTDSATGKPMFCPSQLVDRGWGAYLVVKAKNLPLP